MTEPVTGTIIGIAAGSEYVKILLSDLHESAKTRFKRAKIDKLNRLTHKTIFKKLTHVENVKTIWNILEEVNLRKFYYPSSVYIPEKSEKLKIDRITDVTEKTNIILEGTAGQGKSILLRYLASTEIRCGGKIPIFIELRKIANNKTLLDHIKGKLKDLGFIADDIFVEELLLSGKSVLFLDGFDEVNSSKKRELINDIEQICERFEDTIIAITSRPGSGIQNSEHFRIVSVCPTEQEEHLDFLKKICNRKQQAETIHKAIIKSSHEIQSLLTTPLLLTLLTFVYKSEQSIPNNIIEFYTKLFYILFTKHDSTKPGFEREIKSQLTESKLEEVFSTFCFLTRQNQKSSLTRQEALDYSEKAVATSNITTEPSAFIDDTANVICLMIEEGLDYHFIHKSVQEFYAARFITKKSDDVAKRFYSLCLRSYSYWEQEIKFLLSMDQYRSNKYFLIPALKEILEMLNKKPNPEEIFDNCLVLVRRETLAVNGYSNIEVESIIRFYSDFISEKVLPNLTMSDAIFVTEKEYNELEEQYKSKAKDRRERPFVTTGMANLLRLERNTSVFNDIISQLSRKATIDLEAAETLVNREEALPEKLFL